MAETAWPALAWVAETWPQLGAAISGVPHGSGWRLDTALGTVYLKRRPHARIQVEVWVLHELQARGIPVTVPLLARDGTAFRLWGSDAIWAYQELPGAVRSEPTGPTMSEDFYAVGAAAADLDLALADLDVTHALALGLPVRAQPLGRVAPLQIVHRDFHADNVLFDPVPFGRTGGGGLRLSGFLDFDHLELGPRIVDLCHPATSAQARLWERSSADPTVGAERRDEQWFSLWHSVVAGYASRITLSAEELAATADMMIGIDHDFATWFTEIADPVNAQFCLDLAQFCRDHADRIVNISRRAAGSEGR